MSGKLTKAQREILSHLNNGFDLWLAAPGFRFIGQKNGMVNWSIKRATMNQWRALLRLDYIAGAEVDGDLTWRITDAGRDALESSAS